MTRGGASEENPSLSREPQTDGLPMKSLILVLVLFFAGAALAAEAPKPPAELIKALDLIAAKDYAGVRAVIAPLVVSGDKDARHMLGYLEENGFGGPKNLPRAIEHYYQAAIEGSADAQFALGELAFNGGAVKQDYERAAGWFRMAAPQKHVGAQTRLGQMHAEGIGAPKDPRIAVGFFERSATAGDPSAAYFLGNAYLAGEGVAQSAKKAAEWYGRAAQKGHPDAQYNLALLYDSESLGPPDLQKTYALMKSAAASGLPAAYVALGLMAHNGKTPAEEKAADWFEKAARADDAQGQFLYAVSLAEGDGREKNPSEALMWLDRALLASGELPESMRFNAAELRARLAKSAAAPKLRQ